MDILDKTIFISGIASLLCAVIGIFSLMLKIFLYK